MNFDQADVQSLKLRPTLILGVGEFGGSVLQRVRQKLIAHFGAEIDFPILALLWLDEQFGRRDLPNGLSRLSLGLEQPSRLLRKLGGAGFKHIHRWWYPGWATLGEAADDLALSRPAGRVRFFHHYQALRATLQENLARLRDPENSTQLLNSAVLRERRLVAQIQFDQSTQVHVVVSGGEGGSGMLVDLGFLLRELVPDAAVSRTGWVFLPETEHIRERANTYALLKELNHYSLDRHGFAAEWEPNKTIRPAWTAFDACYLQPGASAEQSELMADYLAKELLLADFGEQRRSLRLNVQTQASIQPSELPEELQQRLARGFSRVALSRVRLGHEAATRACAARLASQTLQSLLGPDSPPAATPSGKVLELLNDEKSTRRAWIGRLLEARPEQVQAWGKESWRSLQRGHRSLTTHLGRVLQQGQRWLENELIAPLASQRESLLGDELARLRELYLQSVQAGPWGLRQVLHRLPETCATLKRWGENFRRQAGALVELQRELAGQIARQQAELTRAEIRKNWDGRRGILIQHHLQRVLEMHLGTLDSPGLLLARLLQEAHSEASLLCRDLVAALQIEEPVGEVALEVRMLVQQIESMREQLAPNEVAEPGWPLCHNLATNEVLWQEIYPRYAENEAVPEIVRTLIGQRGLVACLSQETFLQELLARCRLPLASLPQDYALLSLLPRYEPYLPDLLSQSELSLNASRGESLYHVVGLPLLPPQLSPLQKAQGERAGERLQQQVQQCRPGLTHYFSMAYAEEVVFFSEAVGLTVHELLPLRALRDSYLHLYTQGEALHMDCSDQQFADLAVLGSSELQAAHEAQETFVLATLLQVLQQEGQDWFWLERRPGGPLIHPLGERHRLVPRLSKAPRLRRQLLAESRRRLDDILEGGELSRLVQLAARLAEEKQRRWQSDNGSADLDLLGELEQRIFATSLYQQHQQEFERELAL